MAGSQSTQSSPGIKRKHDDETDAQSKKPRVIGPIMPPAHLASHADSEDEDSNSSSDDDGYGPTLPPSKGDPTDKPQNHASDEDIGPAAPPVSQPAKRDEWMLRPPDQLDFSSRVDPTKLRNRKFNTGRAASATTNKSTVSTWTETAEEKRKRLENEVMGIQAPASSGALKHHMEKSSSAVSKQVQEYNVNFPVLICWNLFG